MNQLIHPDRSYDDFPPAELIGFGELLAISLSSPTNSLTHGLHRYPAKYIPQIPRWAIREYSRRGDLILDPFCGSGTTLVEAMAEGRHSAGVDLDPLAGLISGVKVADLDPTRLRDLLDPLLELGRQVPSRLNVPLPDIKNFDHWFNRTAWAELQALRAGIDRVATTLDERRFMLVVFSSILRAVSNADDQSQKTYVSGTLKKIVPSVLPTFRKRFLKAIEGVTELKSRRGDSLSSVFRTSATCLPFGSDSVDLVVTSPPYLDSVDYMYNLMLEYFWLGQDVGIGSRKEYNARRREYIGSKNPSQTNDLPNAVRHLIAADGVPAYRREVLGPYFSGMLDHFQEAARVLKDGGRYVLVIGNSRTQSGMLPLHDALIALGSVAGLHIEHAFGYRIRRHYMKFPRKGRGGIILMDWVITLRKGEGPKGLPNRLPLIDAQLPPDAVAH